MEYITIVHKGPITRGTIQLGENLDSHVMFALEYIIGDYNTLKSWPICLVLMEALL
jgi:hypothetical protein